MSEGLNHWGFVIAAYAVTVGGTTVLIISSWIAMRRAEARRGRSREG